MTKRVQAKNKICRRLGVNLWGRARNPIVKRDYPPGEHGAKRRKISGYGQQLMAKQKLKGYYGNITERQFRRVYQEAVRRRGDTAEAMVGLLERRLDMVVYRLNFVPTVFAARQFVNHGHVTVNGRRVTIPSYLVREGDVVEVREKSKTPRDRARHAPAAGARRAGLPLARPQGRQGHPRAGAEAGRRALSGPDGAEPGDRILLALSPPGGACDHRPRCSRSGRSQIGLGGAAVHLSFNRVVLW